MGRALDAPFLEDARAAAWPSDAAGPRGTPCGTILHVAQLDEEILDDAVLPVVPHDVGRKSSPRPKQQPWHPGGRGGFKVLEDGSLEAAAPVVGGAQQSCDAGYRLSSTSASKVFEPVPRGGRAST